ncbi:hypothetical protein FRC01_001800 [Tulasnella sp. 417]|nr:hypothetical protein FRC01_001800 [Tulasnella sp. 417]
MEAQHDPRIVVHVHYYPPFESFPSAPALVVQVTELVGSYMIWAGTCDEIPGAESEQAPWGGSQQRAADPGLASGGPSSSLLADSAENAELMESRKVKGIHPKVLAVVRQGRLTKDWACAMPSLNTSIPGAATSLYRSSESDAALSMAQRLGESQTSEHLEQSN